MILALPLAPEGTEKITQLCREYFCNEVFNFEPCLPSFCPDKSRQRRRRSVKDEDEKCFSFIWLIVYDMLNSSEGEGLTKEHDLELAVPFRWSWKVKPAGKATDTIGYGVFPIYGFSDSESATLTQSEVFGRPTVLADISGVILDAMAARRSRYTHAPLKLHGALLAGAVDEPGTLEPVYPTLLPNYEQPVLTVKTSILGALYSGDQPKGRTIIQVVEGPVRRRFTDAENEILDLLNQPESHIAPWLGLKQVVDCRLPKRASYQSIVMQGMELRRLKTPAISRTPFKVRVSRYQALPIVDTLGLQVSQTDQEMTRLSIP